MDAFPELPADETRQASPFPPPSLTEPPAVSVVLHEEPKKRRTGLLVGVGVLVLAVVAAAGFVLLKKDDAEATFSLTAASAAAADVKAVAFTMTMEVMGQAVTADAEIDTESGLTHMTMDMGITDSPIEMIVDTNEKVIYFGSSFLGDSGLPVDTDWVKMDQEFLAENGGDDSMFEATNVGNPLDAGAIFENAKSVTEIGFDEVDGVKVKHFEVVVDTKAALAVSPQLQQQFDELDTDIPDELTYDVYVDEQNQLRRTTIEMPMMGQKVTVDIVIKPLTEAIVIELPAAADVTDFSDLI